MMRVLLRLTISITLAFVLACQVFMLVIMFYIGYDSGIFRDLVFSEDIFKGVYRYFETFSSSIIGMNYITLAYIAHAICMIPFFSIINKLMKRFI